MTRRPFRAAARLAFAAALGAVALSACAEEDTCPTDRGCDFERAVALDLTDANNANNRAAISGTLTFTSSDGTRTTVAIDCSGTTVVCNGTRTVRAPAPTDATELTYEILGVDGTAARGTTPLTFSAWYPNGRGCGPTCREALFVVRLEP